MTPSDVLLGVAIAVGVAGTLIPVLPGSVLVGLAVFVWALVTGTTTGWLVAAVAVGLLGCGVVVKYAVPGRRLRAVGVPTSSLVLGGGLAVVGFFVVPIIGLVLGFVLGVFLAEWRRLGATGPARAATVHALKAVGLGVLIELCFALLAAAAWATGVALT